MKALKASRNLLLPVVAMSLSVGLLACSETRHTAIPNNAEMVTRTTDRGDWTATSDGMVFIDNNTGDKIFWSGPIKQGQTISLNQSKNRITMDGQVLTDRDIPGGTYRIWFQPSSKTAVRERTIERSVERQETIRDQRP